MGGLVVLDRLAPRDARLTGRQFASSAVTWLVLWLAVQQPVAHYRHRHGWTLPDSTITPGAVRETVAAKICGTRTKAFRHTTEATKRRVYEVYGILTHQQGQYEIDHLIPLELGGKDTISNLWPEPATPQPGFHQKDLTENAAHRALCTGRLSADSAQRWIAHDFPSMYDSLVRK
jgi:hypothetical protein